MNKCIAVVVAAAALAVALVVPAGASACNDTVYEHVSNAAAFEPSPYGSVQNKNNTALRFGPGGRIAIPGQAGDHASDNSAVSDYSTGGSGAIVNPQADEACTG
jgi:hypothetical protein